MKPTHCLGAMLLGCCFAAAVSAEQLLYLASTNDKSIVTYSINADSGALTRQSEITLPGRGGAMAFSPDKSFVYAAVTGLPTGQAGVATLKRNTDGSLALLATAEITSRAPYIRADNTGTCLLAAHYADGEVTTYRIVDGICTDELLDRHKTERTAHCIELDPTGLFAFVPHTAPNKVYQYRLDHARGKLIPNNPPFAMGPDEDHQYHQPRHYAHHPRLPMAYTSNERGGGISAWRFDSKTGTLRLEQTLSTLPPGYQGNSAAADIKITPDGRFAYVSNRDTTERPQAAKTQDTLAAFSLAAESGAMKLIGHFPTTHFPRSFCIDTTGRYLYAVGQRSNQLFAYEIDQQTGGLTKLAEQDVGAGPIWVMCAQR